MSVFTVHENFVRLICEGMYIKECIETLRLKEKQNFWIKICLLMKIQV